MDDIDKLLEEDVSTKDIEIPKIDKNTNDLPTVKDGGKVREIKPGEKIGLRERIKMGRNSDIAWIVTMLFSNGTCKQFIICTKDELFKYKNRWYHLRYENSWFDLSFKYYRLFFFDDYVEPLDKEIIRQGETSWWSVTPSNIKGYAKQQYVKNLTESDITKWLKTITVMVMVSLFLSFGMLAYLLIKGGLPAVTGVIGGG